MRAGHVMGVSIEDDGDSLATVVTVEAIDGEFCSYLDDGDALATVVTVEAIDGEFCSYLLMIFLMASAPSKLLVR
jgi:hypothetical protein